MAAMTPPREPRTAAGRSWIAASICHCGLAKSYHPQPGHKYSPRYRVPLAAVLAIEAEAAGAPLREALEQAKRDRNAAYGSNTIEQHRSWSDEEVRRCEANAALAATPAPERTVTQGGIGNASGEIGLPVPAPLDVEDTLNGLVDQMPPNLLCPHVRESIAWIAAEYARLTARAAATEDTDA